jgi:hypothetical protein
LKQDETTGNWWFYVGSVDSNNLTAVGYYPKAIFQGGRLSQFADQVFFGGRVVKAPRAGAEMGNGGHPNGGPNFTASQTNCVYFPSDREFVLATLKGLLDDPRRYPIDLHNRSGTVFDTYLFFGGDGVSTP